MAEVPAAARTPGPAHVRLTALTVFTSGMGLGFLGLCVFRHASPTLLASEAIGAAAAGAMVAVLPGPRFSKRDAPGSGTCSYLVACGIVSGLAIAALALVRFEGLELAPLFLIGLAAGGSFRLAVALVLAMHPPRRVAALVGLCGTSFGLGGLAANLIGAIAVSASSVRSLSLCATTVSAVLAYAAVRARRLRFEPLDRSAHWRNPPHGAGPRRVLLAASLLFQASAWGIAALWLLVYLARGLGLSLSNGAFVLACFWLALAVGWAAGGRMPRIRENLAPLAIPSALAVAGVLFLNSVGRLPAAVLGAMLLGLGMGVLFQFTLCLAAWPSTLGQCRWIAMSLQASLAAALLVGWPVGMLVAVAGISQLLYAVLGCFAGALAAVLILVGDYRLTGDPAVI